MLYTLPGKWERPFARQNSWGWGGVYGGQPQQGGLLRGGFPGALTCVLALHAGVTEDSGGRGCHHLPSASAMVWPPQGTEDQLAGVCTPQTPRASPGQGVALSPWKWAVTLLPLPPRDMQGGLGFLGRHRVLWSVHRWTLGILCSGKFHSYI